MVPFKRKRDPFPRIILQGFVLTVLLSTTHSQWMSLRNPKSNLWFPNMPASKTLQQRSSAGTSIRGGSSSSSSSNNVNNAPENSRQGHQGQQMRSRQIGHRSVPHLHVGQPTYQTVHGGIINRHESHSMHPRNNGGGGYSSSSRLLASPPTRQNSQFASRSGHPHSWMGRGNPNHNSHPTVISSKHMIINVNQPKNKGPHWPSGSYSSSRRLQDVGRAGVAESGVTRRPITQIAGALQDSWPNSNTHHHLSPVMKNQRPNGKTNNYYDESNWGANVRVADPIEIKSKVAKEEGDKSVERKLAVSGSREKLVSNTLNTLAKLSPKKPIYVYMRVEGIAAIQQGAEAGDVIKKLAGGSKLPFYNGTKTLPKENMPQVFLAPEDLPPPTNYGKIPIPNLKHKEKSATKPTFTKILLPGGTKMTSGLQSQSKTTTTTSTTTTTTTPSPSPTAQQFPFAQSTAQSAVSVNPFLFGLNSNFSDQPLTLEQRLQILQMFQQTQARPQQTYPPRPQTQPTNPTYPSTQPSPSPTPSHNDFLKDVLPKGAILESITPMGGEAQGINQFSRHPAQGQQGPTQNPIQNPQSGMGMQRNELQSVLGNIIQSAVTQQATAMIPGLQPTASQVQTARLGHAQSAEQQRQQQGQQPYIFQHQQQQGQQHHHQFPVTPTPTPYQQNQRVYQQYQPNPYPTSNPSIQLQPAQQIPWMQPKNDNMQQFRPRPQGHPPPRGNTLKNALSFLGIQSTPRPIHNQNNAGPTAPPTQRPFAYQHQANPSTPIPQYNIPSPTPRVPFNYPPVRPGMIPANRRFDSVEVGQKPPQTVIVQTPDATQPNGPKSTFVISNGEGNNIPDLNKIMKVLTEMDNRNQHHPQQQINPSGAPPQQFPTRQPVTFHSTPTPATPTRRPTAAPFNHPTGRPTPYPFGQQQPQVMIRHPSGTPTPGPVIVNTGRPDGLPLHQIVSSTFGPSPSTPRPSYIQTPSGPMMISPTPSGSPMQIIKAISPQSNSHQPTGRPYQHQQQQGPSPTPTVIHVQQPQQNRQSQSQPQIIFGPSGTPNTMIMQQIMNQIPGVLAKPTVSPNSANPVTAPPAVLPPGMASLPPGTVPKIIEVDPNMSPEEIQKSIMESIRKHQKEKHGEGSGGPIVINADPALGNALGNSSLFMNIQSSEIRSSPKPGSSEIPQSSSNEEPVSINQVRPTSKEHHHSKEVSDEKPNRRYKSDESIERISQEEKVIEKVITEEKIVWNPGQKDGEMIPSRIKTEERIIITPHGSKSNDVTPTESDLKTTSSENRPSALNLLTNLKNKHAEEDSSSSNSETADSTNFAGMLRSKLKFEKMKQQMKTVSEPENTNPFLRYLTPATGPTDGSTLPLSESTMTSGMSPDPTVAVTGETSPLMENGRFKIRPGDVSNTNRDIPPGPIYGITPSGQPILLSPTSPTFMVSPSPSPSASPSPSGFPPMNPSPGSYIGPSPSSIPFLQASPSPSSPSFASPSIAPGTQEERLIFIPASPSPLSAPSIQTKNAQNQTVVFTTMNKLPDLMSQLGGSKTEIRMIDDMKNFQATLAQVQATQGQDVPTPPAPTQADRRLDEDRPFTWRPNGTVPIPTLESLKQKYPSGPGANVLHAVSAGLSANDAQQKWPQQQQQPQFLYTMVNGVPVALNPTNNGYQPIVIQGTKEPVLAYYGYNWNNIANNGKDVSTSKPLESSDSAGSTEPKYTSKFRGSAPTPESLVSSSIPTPSTRDPIDPVSTEYEEMSKESGKKATKSNHKNVEGEDGKGTRRRRPGGLKDDFSTEGIQSVTPNVLSKRIDESGEEEVERNPVKIHKGIFSNSGEKSDGDSTASQKANKLPILLAPSIISQKSVVSKTGSSFSDNKKTNPTAAAVAATTAAETKPASTSAPDAESDEDDIRQTQAELKTLLRKLQQKLGDDVYELGDGLYDYYDELQQVPSTKATTTTTTKGTSKPKKTTKKSKNKKSKKSKSKDKKKDKKAKKNKSKKTKVTTTTTTTTKEPVTVITTTAPALTSHFNQRHPANSIETFSSSTPNAQVSAEKADPTSPVSTEAPTEASNDDIAFVYPQAPNKDLAAAKIHHRRRPLWVRRGNGNGEGVGQGIAQAAAPGKVIRLVRRKRPGAVRRRPVLAQQGSEETSTTTTTTTLSTTAIPVDVLFENTNELGKRAGIPDSVEGSQPAVPKPKRKLKLIRVKGQRAQWKLKMNDEQGEEGLPQAERLVSLKLSSDQQQQFSLPQAPPLPVAPEAVQDQIINGERQSRQDSSTSIEAKVCVRGKCELISNQ